MARLAASLPREDAGLDQGGVQVEVVGHDGGPEDADGDVERPGIRQGGDEALDERAPVRPGQDDLHQEGDADGRHQGEDHGLQLADAEAGQQEQEEHIEGRDEDAGEERQPEQQLQRDGGTDDLGQIAGGDGDLGQQVERQVHDRGVGLPGGLGQVPPADDPQPGREALEEDGHQVGHQEHPEQLVFVAAAAGDVGGPVARIHVAHRHQEGGTGHRQPPAPARPPRGHMDLADLPGEVGIGILRRGWGLVHDGRLR